MLSKVNVMKIFFCVLALTLFAFSRSSYADWSIGIGVGDRVDHHDDRDRHDNRGYQHEDHFYRWHDHPHYGYHMHFLPDGYFTIWVGGVRYFYYDGLYYTYIGGDYVLVEPPIGAYVSAIPPDFQPVIINGRTYYTDNGVYYILTRYHGYKVVAAPVVYVQPQTVVVAQPQQVVVTQPQQVVTQPVTTVTAVPAPVAQDSFTVNVPNNSGSYTPVVIRRSGNGYVGPQGEIYPEFPKVSQLKAMYGK